MRIPASRRALTAAVVGFAIVPLAGCGSSSSSSSGGGPSADPATLLPASTPVYIEANINPSADQKAALDSLSQKVLGVANPETKLVSLIDKSGAAKGVSYENDIKPWLGDKVAIAITSFTNIKHPDFAVVLDTSDPKKAMSELTKSSSYTTKGTVNGVKYIAQADGTRAGIIDNEIVIGTANGFATVAAGKGAKLSSNPQFSQARGKAPADRLAYVYVDTSAFLSLVSKETPALENELGSLQGLTGGIKAASLALVAKPSAIEIDALSVGAKPATSSTPSTLPLGKAPADAWAAATVTNLGPKLNTLVNELGKIGAASNGQNFGQILQQLKQTTGLDLQKDVFSWMGDAGVFVRGTSTSDLGGAIIIHSTDTTASAAGLAKIEQLLGTLGRTPTKIPHGFSVASTANGPQIQVVSEGQFVVIGFGDGIVEDALSPTATLDTTTDFQAATQSLGTTAPNLYVDLKTLFGIAESLESSNASLQAAEPYLNALTSIIGGGSESSYKLEINVK